MPADVIPLDSRRRSLPGPRPKSARFVATAEGKVALEIVLEDGGTVDVLMTPAQGAALVLQGTDAVEIAEGISRG